MNARRATQATADRRDRSLNQGKHLGYEENVKESKKMKRFFLGLLMALILLAPVVVADTVSSKALTIAATWEGGVLLSLDHTALTFPNMEFPADSVWFSSNEGQVVASMLYSVATGHKIRLAYTAEAWSPIMTGFGPQDTIRLIGNGGLGGVIIPAAPVGSEAVIFTSGTDLGNEGSVMLDIQVKNVFAKPKSYSNTLTFVLSDIE